MPPSSGPPSREATPSLSQRDTHPAIPSPLNPDFTRAPRVKKETLKKKESKPADRNTPEVVNAPEDDGLQAQRVIFGKTRAQDFQAAKGATFAHHHDFQVPDGRTIQFYEVKD